MPTAATDPSIFPPGPLKKFIAFPPRLEAALPADPAAPFPGKELATSKAVSTRLPPLPPPPPAPPDSAILVNASNCCFCIPKEFDKVFPISLSLANDSAAAVFSSSLQVSFCCAASCCNNSGAAACGAATCGICA